MEVATVPLYTYTGHPLVDVGASVIAVFARRHRVEDIQQADLDTVREFIRRHYVAYCGQASSNKAATSTLPFSGYLSLIFTNNTPFIAPTTRDDKRKAQTEAIIDGKAPKGPEAEPCVFCSRPGARVSREHVPMLQGAGNTNFTPGARPGVPVCPQCLLAIAACPLGTVQSQARMLLVHSEEPQLTLEVAHQFLEINRQMLSMADGKYKDQRFPRTILMDALLGTHALDEAMAGPIDASVTAYHITNYGTSPDVDVLQLPMQSLAFVRAAKQDAAWSFLRNRGWYMGLPRAARDKGEIPDEYRPGQHRNAFYEDLFRLEQLTVTPTEFIRRHLDWRLDAHRWRQTPQSELPNAWPLTELFLRMVLFMEKQRVDTIRTVGERLARYVMDNDEARFFRRLMLASRYIGFRTHLVNASAREAKRGNPPLISFEEFVTVFEDGDETARLDWTLARDLVLMKMMDDLHALDFDFGQSLENEAEGEGEAEQEARDDSQ